MNINIIKNQNISILKGCLLMMLLFYVSADSIIIGTNSGSLAVMVSKYIPFLTLLISTTYIVIKKYKFQTTSLLIAAVFLIGMLLTLCFAPGNNLLKNTLFHIALMLCGLMITTIVPFGTFFKIFEKTIYFLCIFSLIVFAVAAIIPSIIKLFPQIQNLANNSYYFLGFSVVPRYGLVDSFFLRNFGIFREPGVFQIFVNIALCVHLFYEKNKKHFFRIIIYVITILTTTSTTGIFAMIILLLAFIMQRNSEHRNLKIILVGFAVAILVFSFSGISDKLLYSVLKVADSSNPSTVARLGSVYANVDMLINNPLVGIGQVEQAAQFPVLVEKYAGAISKHNTNTILYVFSCHGILLGFLYLIGIINFAKKFCNKNRLIWSILTIFIIILLSGENIIYSYSAYIILFYGYQKIALEDNR